MITKTQDIETYLDDTLGLQARAGELGRKLPAYLRKGCKHFVLLVEGHSFVAAVFDAGSFNLAAYKKQRRELEELTGLPAIAVLPSVTPYQRRTLVSEGISFVVPGSQLFVPALGAVFAERRAATPLPAPVQELSPAAQLVLLDLIYQGDDAPQQQMTIADRLGFDAMKTSRGVRQLEAAGLVDVTKCGRANMVRPRCAGKVLWEAAQPFLKNPARHEVCVFREEVPPGSAVAGETFVSRRSDLAEGAILTRAAPSSALRGLKALDPSWVEDSSGMIYLQGWIYDPAILGKRGEADPLSVALPWRDVEGERLQAAAWPLLEGVCPCRSWEDSEKRLPASRSSTQSSGAPPARSW